MALLTLLITCPFVLIANSTNKDREPFILTKLFGIWLLSLIYITVNDNFRVPVGIICAAFIIYKAKTNKKPKFTALIIGIISIFLSTLVYLFYKI